MQSPPSTQAERARSRKDVGGLYRDASCARKWLAANDAYLESCHALEEGCSCVAIRLDCPTMNALGPGAHNGARLGTRV
jgi:hypothetical protein